MRDVFTEIYKNKKWQDNYGSESGPGSSIECSEPYLNFLQKFCQSSSIKSILDLGCGDFNLMKHFDFKDKYYLGVDIVSHVIYNNNQSYGRENIKFECSSITDREIYGEFDLVLIKDVLQHLSLESIQKILKNIKKFKYVIITNDISDNNNIEINDGGYSPVNLLEDPYKIDGSYIFEWQSCYFLKKSFLIN